MQKWVTDGPPEPVCAASMLVDRRASWTAVRAGGWYADAALRGVFAAHVDVTRRRCVRRILPATEAVLGGVALGATRSLHVDDESSGNLLLSASRGAMELYDLRTLECPGWGEVSDVAADRDPVLRLRFHAHGAHVRRSLRAAIFTAERRAAGTPTCGAVAAFVAAHNAGWLLDLETVDDADPRPLRQLNAAPPGHDATSKCTVEMATGELPLGFAFCATTSDSRVLLWDARQPSPQPTITLALPGATSGALCPNGTPGNGAGLASLFSAAAPRMVASAPVATSVVAPAVGGTLLAVGDSAGILRTYDLRAAGGTTSSSGAAAGSSALVKPVRALPLHAALTAAAPAPAGGPAKVPAITALRPVGPTTLWVQTASGYAAQVSIDRPHLAHGIFVDDAPVMSATGESLPTPGLAASDALHGGARIVAVPSVRARTVTLVATCETAELRHLRPLVLRLLDASDDDAAHSALSRSGTDDAAGVAINGSRPAARIGRVTAAPLLAAGDMQSADEVPIKCTYHSRSATFLIGDSSQRVWALHAGPFLP